MRALFREPAASLAIIILGAALAAPGALAALEYRVAREVVVAADERIDDDMLILAETVRIDGVIEGDLMVYGCRIEIDGVVRGDLFGCGHATTIDGRVGDDLRFAGTRLALGPGSSVGDDALWAGLRLLTEPGSAIGGSLLFAGYRALLAGDVAEQVRGEVYGVELRGGFGGDVALGVDRAGLSVADSARIGGSLTHAPEPSRGARRSSWGWRLLVVLLIVAAFWSWAVAARYRTPRAAG